MSVQDLKAEIAQLPPQELADLAAWFAEFQAQAWDRQIAQDAKAGRFDDLIQRARDQVRSGQCRPL